MTTSVFREVSIGTVVENLALGASVAKISPLEWLPMMEGEQSSKEGKIDVSGTDGNGDAYTGTLSYGNFLKAEWLPFGTNQMTPPNLRRGMLVKLWQNADDPDGFYWTYCGLDRHLMRLETVINAYSNTRDENTKKLDPSNSWYTEYSTHAKRIRIVTNKSDGEPFAYDLLIDAKSGKVSLSDDDGNFGHLDSEKQQWYFENKSGSFIDMTETHLRIETGDTVNFKTTDFNIKCENIQIDAKVGVFNIDDLTFNGTSFLVNHPTIFSTTVLIKGAFTAAATSVMQGAATIWGKITGRGDVEVQGDSEVAGRMTNAGVAVGNTHTHTSANPGSQTSPPSGG